MKVWAIMLALATAAIVSPAPAFAHAVLEQASPHHGETLSRTPGDIRLQFSDAIEPALAQVSLSAADGTPVALGAPATGANGRASLVAPIPAPLAAGVYPVQWRVVSTDGHTSHGSFHFTVKP